MFNQLRVGICLLLAASQSLSGVSEQGGVSGEELLRNNCLGCHVPIEEGLSRINLQRKTPEGWEMTISRMMLMHGLRISNHDIPVSGSARHQMVKYLADTQGLAPEETQGVRYLMEQDNNRVEDLDPQLMVMCGRCHTGARVALQRRSEKEWQYLVNFHLGQYPSTEYSLFGRDREWLKIAREEVVPMLAKTYPLKSASWKKWQQTEKPDLSGRWVMSGHMPGKGYFNAVMTASSDKKDYYSLTLTGNYSNGEAISGTGKSVVYTGYEWRGNIDFGDIRLRQVLAASADGNTMTGRFYQKGQDLVGLQISALRDAGVSQILSVTPTHIKRGDTATITLSGTNMEGALLISEGVDVEEIVSRSAHRIVARVSAGTNNTSSYADIRVGKATLSKQLAVYHKINTLEIEPAYGIARIGDNGGSTPKVNTVFRAIGIDYGSDGVANTQDDINLGYIENVSWKVVPRDAIAERDEDVKFAGRLDSATGIFYPADAGPNPDRYRGTNNAGNLNIVARLLPEQQSENEKASDEVTGTGRLLVTVQRWNDPPLK